MQALGSYTLAEFGDFLSGKGQKAYRAKQVFEWLYRKREFGIDRMTNLPADLRATLSSEFDLALPEVVRVQGSEDTTRKFLFKFPTGDLVESVLIPASPALYGEKSDRRTICLSSQVGCAYGCKFCASGLDGWKRNLSAAEIVGQFLQVEAISGERINNIVFMGMGEPLANYANLLKAIEIINAQWGIGLGARHITISTSGLAPKIRELAAQPLQVRLAISLHGATDEVRSQIMPVNRKYPLAELISACEEFCAVKKQKITFEFILIAGINDSLDQARALAKLARRLNAKINLIPYNTVDGLEWARPDEPTQDRFLETVKAGGAFATLRREKGHDIAAACGQLRLQKQREDEQATLI